MFTYYVKIESIVIMKYDAIFSQTVHSFRKIVDSPKEEKSQLRVKDGELTKGNQGKESNNKYNFLHRNNTIDRQL